MSLQVSQNCIPALVLIFLSLILTQKNALSYKIETEVHALSYLTTYGFLDPEVMPRGLALTDIDEKLKEFQRFFRIPVTGKLDGSTLMVMNTPRCGCPDIIKDPKDEGMHNETEDNPSFGGHSHNHHYHRHRHHHGLHSHNHFRLIMNNRRFKRYAISSVRWEKNVVTYNIAKYPSRPGLKVSTREIEDAIHQAFNLWEQHINLEFSYQPNNVEVDIEIRFESAHHNDGLPFDGPGKTLGHAFLPGRGIGGDIHFDEDEDWRVGEYNGINVLQTATHELGHSLGLGHSSDKGAIMYPTYRGYVPNLQLGSDDILGAQALYGVKRNHLNTPRPPTLPTRRTTNPTATTTKSSWVNTTTARSSTLRPSVSNPDNDLCSGKPVDAIATLLNGTIFAFKGSKVYELGNNSREEEPGVLPGWPKYIGSYFGGVEHNLDCVLTRANGKTYFFKGEKYWRFTGRRMDKGYPHSISMHFPGIPDNLDAAFEWDDDFVFTKGNQFWRFNTRMGPQDQPIEIHRAATPFDISNDRVVLNFERIAKIHGFSTIFGSNSYRPSVTENGFSGKSSSFHSHRSSVQSYFPMPLGHWGLTKPLDAAFTAPNGNVYFFQDSYYWEFDKHTHKVKTDGNWPGSAAMDCFGCQEP